MKILKERKPLLVKILAAVSFVFLLVLLCYAFSTSILIPKLCKNVGQDILQNHFQIDYSNISLFSLLKEELFWDLCEEEQEVLFLEACQEQDRNLPPNTEILVSACTSPSVVGVPDGKILLVRERKTRKMYLLDLRTGEKKDVPNDPLLFDYGILLNSELVWLEGNFGSPESPGYRPHYILDLTNGQRYKLLELDWFPQLDNQFNPQYYKYLQTAEKVFLHHSKNVLIALATDFRHHPKGNVIIHALAPSAEYGEVFEKLMKDLGVDYQIVNFLYGDADVPSPTGRYIVRGDGIYLSEANTLAIPDDWYFRGWYYDESGVVIQGGGSDLISAPLGGGVRLSVFSPVLKLRLPTP